MSGPTIAANLAVTAYNLASFVAVQVLMAAHVRPPPEEWFWFALGIWALIAVALYVTVYKLTARSEHTP